MYRRACLADSRCFSWTYTEVESGSCTALRNLHAVDSSLPLFWIATCNKGFFGLGLQVSGLVCAILVSSDLKGLSRSALVPKLSSQNLSHVSTLHRWLAYSLPHSWTATCNKNLCPPHLREWNFLSPEMVFDHRAFRKVRFAYLHAV